MNGQRKLETRSPKKIILERNSATTLYKNKGIAVYELKNKLNPKSLFSKSRRVSKEKVCKTD
jgi:hypothetical protein